MSTVYTGTSSYKWKVGTVPCIYRKLYDYFSENNSDSQNLLHVLLQRRLPVLKWDEHMSKDLSFGLTVLGVT